MIFKYLQRRPELGVDGGRLRELKGTPNGVSSQAGAGESRVAPIRLEGEADWRDLCGLARGLHRSKVVKEREDYLWLEVASRFWGFLDDLELYWNRGANHAEVRSEARLGYSDLGVNRRRVEALRKAMGEVGGRRSKG